MVDHPWARLDRVGQCCRGRGRDSWIDHSRLYCSCMGWIASRRWCSRVAGHWWSSWVACARRTSLWQSWVDTWCRLVACGWGITTSTNRMVGRGRVATTSRGWVAVPWAVSRGIVSSLGVAPGWSGRLTLGSRIPPEGADDHLARPASLLPAADLEDLASLQT